MYIYKLRYLLAISLTACLFFGAKTSMAGPYRTIHIDDQPLGNTLTHIFWLRTLEDNQERYDNPFIHQFLIKQNIETGVIEDHWLLRRLIYEARIEISDDGESRYGILNVYEPPLDEDEAKPTSEPPDSTLYRDAFEILRSEEAMPVSSNDFSWSHSALQSWKVTNEEGIMYVDADAEDNVETDTLLDNDIRLGADDVVKQINALLHPTIDEMKKFVWPGDDPRSAIPRESLSIDLSLCSTGNQMDFHTAKPTSLMQLDCEGEDLITWYKVWVRME